MKLISALWEFISLPDDDSMLEISRDWSLEESQIIMNAVMAYSCPAPIKKCVVRHLAQTRGPNVLATVFSPDKEAVRLYINYSKWSYGEIFRHASNDVSKVIQNCIDEDRNREIRLRRMYCGGPIDPNFPVLHRRISW